MRCITIGLLCLTVGLSGCGGSGGSAFTSTSLHSGGGGPSGPKSYSSPTEVPNSQGGGITNVSPNGQMIGETSAGVPLYWATPTSVPTSIPVGTFANAQVTGINNSGQMVGSAPVAGQFVPIYWSSPSATPVALVIPAGQPNARAGTINASGQIVGSANTGNNLVAVYWASSSSNPRILAGIGGGSSLGQGAIRIADTGAILGESNSNLLIWPSPTANAEILPLPSGDAYDPNNNPLGPAFNQETGEMGGVYFPSGGTDHGYLRTLPGYNFVGLKSPPGFADATFLDNIGPSQLAVGYEVGTSSHAVIWTSPTVAFQDLNTLIPLGSGWVLNDAIFVTDSGQIIGEGTNPSNQLTYFVVSPK